MAENQEVKDLLRNLDLRVKPTGFFSEEIESGYRMKQKMEEDQKAYLLPEIIVNCQ